MERLTAVLYVLSQSDGGGCRATRITELGLYGGAPEGQREQLARDITNLRALGWEIDNVAGAGEDAVYRLVARDNRLLLQFTAAERLELYRCAQMARLRDIASDLRPDVRWAEPTSDFLVEMATPPQCLDDVVSAVAHHCRLRFRYYGRDRDVLPRATYDHSGTWYLVAREVDTGEQKTFRVNRMSDVVVDAPRTALTSSAPIPPRLDPLSWDLDDPVDVVVETTLEHRDTVVARLGAAAAEARVGDAVRLTIRTTNRAAFLHRVCQLRERVRLVGPEDLRAQLRAHLLAVAGGA